MAEYDSLVFIKYRKRSNGALDVFLNFTSFTARASVNL